MNIELRPRPRIQSHLRVIETDTVPQSSPAHVNPIEWHQSLGLARQACARIFRDGGTPADALAAFAVTTDRNADWARAVELIAHTLARPSVRRAA